MAGPSRRRRACGRAGRRRREVHGALVGEPFGARLVAAGQQPVLARRARLAAREPHGCDTRRSVMSDTVDVLEHLELALDAVAAGRRAGATAPRAQARSAAPASGYARSSASTGVSRVFVIAVCTPFMPGRGPGRPPCPPPIVS